MYNSPQTTTPYGVSIRYYVHIEQQKSDPMVNTLISFISKITKSLSLFSLLVTTSFLANSVDNIRDGAYLDIGIGLDVESDPFIFDDENGTGFAIYVNGRYQKYGFFVELPLGTSKQQSTILSLGYNFLNTQHWSYDLRLALNHRDLDHILPVSNRISRRVSHSKLGLRVLGDFDNTHIKLILAGASGDQDGGLYTSAWEAKIISTITGFFMAVSVSSIAMKMLLITFMAPMP